MLRQLLCAASAVLATSACTASSEEASTEQPPAIELPQSQRDIDPEAFHNSIQAAMEEVPDDLRPHFQVLFACEVRKNNQRAEPGPIDAAYIRALTEYLKQNPTAGNSCQQ